jgi:DNA repair exonuclease SbcCD ATPase subunit
MTDTDKLKQLENTLEELDKTISNQAEAVEQKAQQLKVIHTRYKELADAIEKNQGEKNIAAQEHQVMLHELAQKRIKGVQLRDDIKALERKMAVDELFAKQPTAWDVLPIRMKHHQESNQSNLVGIGTKETDVDAIIKQWKAAYEDKSPRFSHWDTELRGTINHYTQAVKKVCEFAVDKHDIAVDVRQQPNMVLDRWLMRQDNMRLWFK